jgi:WD40 repeat protein/outer membrane biosynthesis protein TonB
MPISMECPSCMNSFSLPDELAGRKSKCPDCQFTVFVPRGETTVDQSAAVASSSAPPPVPKPRPKKKAVEVDAVTPVPQKKTRAVKKTPPVVPGDNPFAFTDSDTPSQRRRKRGSGGVMLLLALLAMFAFGGLLLVAGGGAFWLYWSRTKAEEARTEAESRAKMEAIQAEMEALRAEKEAKAHELPKEEPKADKPKKPDAKPVNDPIVKPNNDPEKKAIVNQPPAPVPPPTPQPPPARQPRLTLAPITEYTVKAGEMLKISVSVVREDCKGIVTINVTGLPPGIRAEPVILDDDIDRASLQMTVDATTTPGKYSLSVTATLAAKKPVTDGKMFELTVEKAATAPVDQPAANGPLQLLGGVRVAVSGQIYTVHTGAVESVALSADGKAGLSGGADGTVELWMLDREPAKTITIQKNGPAITAVALSPDGKWAACGDVKGTVRLFNVEKRSMAVLPQGKVQPGMVDADNRVRALEFSPKSDLLAALTPRALTTWNVPAADKAFTILLDNSSCFHFTADGGSVYAISGKSIAVVDTSRFAVPTYLGGGKPKEFAATTFDCYRARQELLALVPKDKQAELQRISEKTGEAQTLVTFTEMAEIPVCVAVADKSGYALTCDRTGVIRGWELDTGKELIKLQRDKVELRSLAINPDGRRAIAGAVDGSVRIFDFRNEKPN